MHPYSVIEKPILSEKSNDLREREGKYSFVVKRDATKDDVKKAGGKMQEGQVLGRGEGIGM